MCIRDRPWIYGVVGCKAFKQNELGKTLYAKDVAAYLCLFFFLWSNKKKDVAAHYAEKMSYAKSTAAVSNAWVDTALTVHNRVLSVPIANKWLEWCEEHLMSKNPWSSIYALQALVDRGQTPDRIAWAVWGMTDLLRVDAIDLRH